MPKGETLRAFVNKRLTAAAEEIFARVEKTIAEYEEELCRCKEENQRKQRLLDEALARPPVPEVQQINLQSTDVQIQTETRSEASVLKLGVRQSPGDVACIIVKSENDDGDNEECAERPTEVCSEEISPEISIVRNAAPKTPNTRSSVSLSNQDETGKTPSVGKRKRGRPRRLVPTADAEKHQPQPSKQPKEKRVEPKRIERHGAKTDAGPTRTPQKTQSQTEVEGSASSKKDLEETPVQSKCPKPKRPRIRRPKQKREYRKNVLETLGHFISDKNTEKGSFRCSCCDRVFTRLHHLERHVLIHTGEKAFPCSVCDKSFRLKQHLMSHMDIHKDERRFGCPVCARKFKRRDNLGRHILVHSGLRPHACPQCDVQFSLKKNLERHMVVHNRDDTYCCSYCEMKFSSPFYYNKHMKTHM